MLDLSAEPVDQAASNSLIVFYFCNLLIVVVILMSPKPSSNLDERSKLHLAVVTHDGVIDEQRRDIEQPPEDGETWPEVMELCVCENLENESRSYRGEGEDDNEDDGESNNDDDDELRRRIEAFIDKVNREWKEEKLRTQST